MAVIPCLLFSTAMAQGDGGMGLHFGVKGGANLNKINGEQFQNGFDFNYYLGTYVGFGITPHFGLQPELIFSQSTSKTGNQFSDIYTQFPNGDNQKINLNYLSIPLLANLKLNRAIWLELGPQYSILMNDHQSLVENGKSAFKSGNFAVLGGLWFQTPIGLNLSARYIIGLSNMNDINDQNSWKSQSIQLGVGYSFF